MSNFEDIKTFVMDNIIAITFVLFLIAIIYINIKVNDVDYRLQQTIMNSYTRIPSLKYGY